MPLPPRLLSGLLVAAALASAGAASTIGERAVAVAAFDPVDATSGIQAAIDSKAMKVLVPNTGKPWLVGPIRLESSQEVEFEPGVVVMAREGAFRGKRDALFSAEGKRDITLRGPGASLVMRKADYQAAPYEPSEWRHAIALRSVSGVRIIGLRVAFSGGDGIYIGRAEGLPPHSSDVLVSGVLSEGHHRQGMSVISVDGLRVERSTFTGTNGTDPQAGVDFEPNAADERLTDIVLEDSRFDGNASWGILFALMRLKSDSEPVSVRLTGCGAKDNKAGVLRVMQSPVGGRIVIERPSFSGRMMLEKGGGVAIVRD